MPRAQGCAGAATPGDFPYGESHQSHSAPKAADPFLRFSPAPALAQLAGRENVALLAMLARLAITFSRLGLEQTGLATPPETGCDRDKGAYARETSCHPGRFFFW